MPFKMHCTYYTLFQNAIQSFNATKNTVTPASDMV